MSAFKPKRVSGAELAAQISPATAHLPAAVPVEPPPRPARVVQINFKASEAMADLIATEGAKAGSTRRFLARLLRDAGYEVPEVDVNPPDTRRRGLGRIEG
jgi:hypothetical protein